MKKVVLVFGLLSGLVSSAVMFLTMPFVKSGALYGTSGYVVGYTSIVLSFLLVFFGIRSYRENAGGVISFGRGMAVGILITLISCLFYVASWEIIYFKMMPDFGTKYATHAVDSLREKGASDAAIEAKKKEMAKVKAMMDDPLINGAMSFIEPFPVGLLVTLVSAAILRKRNPLPVPAAAQAV
jgi:Protein of unknown function (DUF4199)